jgi:hypothetical protein
MPTFHVVVLVILIDRAIPHQQQALLGLRLSMYVLRWMLLILYVCLSVYDHYLCRSDLLSVLHSMNRIIKMSQVEAKMVEAKGTLTIVAILQVVQ